MLKIIYIIGFSFIVLLTKGQIYTEDAVFDMEVIYDYSFFNDSLQTQNPSKREMSLLINEDLSLFQLTSRFTKDSITIAQSKTITARLFGTISPITNTNYRIFKKKDNITTVEAINGFDINMTNSFHVYTERTDMFEWIIKQDTMTINEFTCQKAELEWGGRKWVAWFAPDIPIFDGPYKFKGLPGLIINISDEQGYFTFSLQSISYVNKYYSVIPRKDLNFNKTNRDDFFKHRKSFRDNMYEHAIAEGMAPNEDIKKRATEYGQKDNNHIERY